MAGMLMTEPDLIGHGCEPGKELLSEHIARGQQHQCHGGPQVFGGRQLNQLTVVRARNRSGCPSRFSG
jgi:hypothetical protein